MICLHEMAFLLECFNVGNSQVALRRGVQRKGRERYGLWWMIGMIQVQESLYTVWKNVEILNILSGFPTKALFSSFSQETKLYFIDLPLSFQAYYT